MDIENIYFKVNNDDIEVLNSPLDFYSYIIYGIEKSKFRITMSSLYFGDGYLEKYLLNCLSNKLKNTHNLKLKMIFDYNRCSRKNKDDESNINIIFNELESVWNEQNENYIDIGFFKATTDIINFLPFNGIKEIFGTYHIKFLVFDNNIILTGANLSEDYFLNRKDRYIIINNCIELANYLEDYSDILISNSIKIEDCNDINYKKVKKKSIKIQNKILSLIYDKIKPSKLISELSSSPIKNINKNQNTLPQVNVDTYEEIKNKFIINDSQYSVNNILREYNENINQERKMFKKLSSSNSKDYVYIIPTLNNKSLEIFDDENFLKNYLSQIKNSELTLCSGYFNIPKFISNILRNISKDNKINFVCAELESNGFYNAKGFKGFIPYMYKYSFLKLFKKLPSLNFYSYYNNGIIFHTKGFWSFSNESNFSSTIIGSSNYSYRSFSKDLEMQFYMFSSNNGFKEKINKERNEIIKSCNQITNNNIKMNFKRIKFRHKIFYYLFRKFL